MEASSFLWVLKNHYNLSKETDILGLKLPLKNSTATQSYTFQVHCKYIQRELGHT